MTDKNQISFEGQILNYAAKELLTQRPLVLSPKQAAETIGISTSTLAKFRLDGKGPKYSKLGRRVFYEESELRRWIGENQHASTDEYGQYS